MDQIRLATPGEISGVFEGADITPMSTVVAFDNAETQKPDFAVLRQVFEIDPILFAEGTSIRRKVLFGWALDGALRIQGTIPGYYFQVSAAEEAEEWRSTLENFGAKKVSATPEFRYFKLL